MTEYPQDIIKAADDVCIALNIPSTVDNCNPIMLALMARDERAAKIAEDYECDITKDSMMGAPFAIATAIRTQ